MLNRVSHTQLLRYAGLFTWAMVGVALALYSWLPPSTEVLEGASSEVVPSLGPASIAYFAFGLAYWLVTRSLGVRRPRWYDVLLLAVLTAAAIGVSHLTGTGLAAVLMLIIAGVIPWLLPVPLGVVWLVLQHVALVPVFINSQGLVLFEAILLAAVYTGYSSFAFVIGLVAKQQAQARDEQRRLNAELRATRALLAESSRVSERVRISRELHDLLGHHLTALILNLEVAGHLSAGKAQEHVRQSHTLAKLLLTDVREAVSEMRDEGAIDLSGALRALVEGVPALDIHLQMPSPLPVENPELAHVLLRCAQEIITNAVRHAGASTLSLTVARDAAGLRLQAQDNGSGSDAVEPGNGLRGMRERVLAHGGQIDIITGHGQGFALDIRLPLENSE